MPRPGRGGHPQRREESRLRAAWLSEKSLSLVPFFLLSGQNSTVRKQQKPAPLERGPLSQSSLDPPHMPALGVMPFAVGLGTEGQRGKMLNF